jgi:hypothetical protein
VSDIVPHVVIVDPSAATIVAIDFRPTPPPQSLPALAHWACANSVQIERYVSITYPLSRLLARIVLPNYTQLEIALGPAAKGAATI